MVHFCCHKWLLWQRCVGNESCRSPHSSLAGRWTCATRVLVCGGQACVRRASSVRISPLDEGCRRVCVWNQDPRKHPIKCIVGLAAALYQSTGWECVKASCLISVTRFRGLRSGSLVPVAGTGSL